MQWRGILQRADHSGQTDQPSGCLGDKRADSRTDFSGTRCRTRGYPRGRGRNARADGHWRGTHGKKQRRAAELHPS